MKYKKYYDMVKNQAEIYDKTQNCEIGQTWNYHLFPVIENAKKLADKYGADKDIVEVSAIFHDYADLLDFANREKHHIIGAEYAEKFLREDGYDEKFIERVKSCILNHRASVVREKFSIEEICVADADAMTHIDNFVELLCWRAYMGDSVLECNKFAKTKIQKSFAKMSKETQELMREKYESIMRVML